MPWNVAQSPPWPERRWRATWRLIAHRPSVPDRMHARDRLSRRLHTVPGPQRQLDSPVPSGTVPTRSPTGTRTGTERTETGDRGPREHREKGTVPARPQGQQRRRSSTDTCKTAAQRATELSRSPGDREHRGPSSLGSPTGGPGPCDTPIRGPIRWGASPPRHRIGCRAPGLKTNHQGCDPARSPALAMSDRPPDEQPRPRLRTTVRGRAPHGSLRAPTDQRTRTMPPQRPSTPNSHTP